MARLIFTWHHRPHAHLTRLAPRPSEKGGVAPSAAMQALHLPGGPKEGRVESACARSQGHPERLVAQRPDGTLGHPRAPLGGTDRSSDATPAANQLQILERHSPI